MNTERFEQGQTFTEFLETAVKLKDLWVSTHKRVEIPRHFVEELSTISGQWHLVVLNEDWCLDAVTSVTPVAQLVDLVDNIDLRIFGRDTNLDLMDAHLTNGGRSIPVMILYDETWTERAWWGPRPKELQAWVTEWMRVNGQAGPKEEKYRYIRGWYARDKGISTMREVVDMIVGVQ
jgi:hypothetical protein